MTTEAQIRKALKFRLKTFKSKKYWKYMEKKGYDRHHVIGKNCDYLLVNLDRLEHGKRQTDPDKYTLDDLIQGLNNIFEYIEELEQ